jgi:hypothetical protein
MALYTLTYSESAKGWPSFYSFYPDWMIGMNNYFYTFKNGNLYRHNTNPVRNNFYGVQYSSSITSVFNDIPLQNKLFKTINIEGDAAWGGTFETDLQTSGFINASWFEKKEQAWYAFIRNSGTVPATPAEYSLRSLNGIGRSQNITGIGTVTIDFSISPLIAIGNIISIGDYLYYSLPPTYSTPVYFGQVTQINVNYPQGINQLVINAAVIAPVINDPYIFFIKNSVAESHGVLGHYCRFTLENSDTTKVELFSLETEAMKSFP